MQSKGKPRGPTVADLMRIRELSEVEFTSLCASMLAPGVNTSEITFDRRMLLAPERPSKAVEGRCGPSECRFCDGPVEPERLNRTCQDITGVPACKACIDDALAAHFGPRPRATFLDYPRHTRRAVARV